MDEQDLQEFAINKTIWFNRKAQILTFFFFVFNDLIIGVLLRSIKLSIEAFRNHGYLYIILSGPKLHFYPQKTQKGSYNLKSEIPEKGHSFPHITIPKTFYSPARINSQKCVPSTLSFMYIFPFIRAIPNYVYPCSVFASQQ